MGLIHPFARVCATSKPNGPDFCQAPDMPDAPPAESMPKVAENQAENSKQCRKKIRLP